MSRTSTTRRSRSGCQVRTTTLRLRAVARQSIERTSSPRTYSRNESNSVPCPRTRTAERPSRSRRRASRDGRCLRDSNGGSERTTPGTATVRCRDGQAERPAGAHGDAVGAQVAAAYGLQRRAQQHPVTGGQPEREPVAVRAGGRLPGVAEHAGEPCAAEGLATTSVDEVGSPSRTGAVGRRAISSSGRLRARAARRPRPAARRPAARATSCRRTGAAPPAPGRAARSSGTRPEIAISGGPGHRPERGVEHLPDLRRPRARPPAAARAGGRGVAWASALTSSGVTKSRPGQPRPRPGRPHQRGRAARADAQAERGRLAGGAGDVDDVRRHLGRDLHLPDRGLAGGDVVGPAHRTHAGARDVAGVEALGVPAQDLQLGLARRDRQHDLEQEAVELGLGQRVGALVLDGVLRRGDQERPRQRARDPVDRHLALLHRLEQRRLGLGRRPVDLVGEQQVGEDRALAEAQLALLAVDDHRAGDVARHQVGGELDPPGADVEGAGEGAHEQGLGHAGHALHQHVAAAQQRHEQAGDRGVLADDGLGDLAPDRGQPLAGVRSRWLRRSRSDRLETR